ncbi:MAG: methyltransferase [Candidatus Dormibacteria bacterium]
MVPPSPTKPARLPPPWVVRAFFGFRNMVGRLHAGIAPPELLLLERSHGLIGSRTLMIAAEFGIADQLASGPKSAAELAGAVGANADALDRILGYMVATGSLGRARDGRYRNNRVSDRLRRDHPQSPRDWILFAGADWVWDIWGQLGHSVRSGESGTVNAYHVPYFEYVNQSNPAAGESFTRALEFYSRIQGPIVAAKYDFSGARRLCDIGGGSAILLADVLQLYADVTGVLFEVPQMLAAAQANISARGLADRCEFVGGDFFEAVPSGCDLYMMQAVLHDWDDQACTRILGNVRQSMPAGARLLVIEALLETDSERNNGLLRAIDLLMLVLTGSGRERTKPQFESIFKSAGFDLTRDLTLPSLAHVFELSPS